MLPPLREVGRGHLYLKFTPVGMTGLGTLQAREASTYIPALPVPSLYFIRVGAGLEKNACGFDLVI